MTLPGQDGAKPYRVVSVWKDPDAMADPEDLKPPFHIFTAHNAEFPFEIRVGPDQKLFGAGFSSWIEADVVCEALKLLSLQRRRQAGKEDAERLASAVIPSWEADRSGGGATQLPGLERAASKRGR